MLEIVENVSDTPPPPRKRKGVEVTVVKSRLGSFFHLHHSIQLLS